MCTYIYIWLLSSPVYGYTELNASDICILESSKDLDLSGIKKKKKIKK